MTAEQVWAVITRSQEGVKRVHAPLKKSQASAIYESKAAQIGKKFCEVIMTPVGNAIDKGYMEKPKKEPEGSDPEKKAPKLVKRKVD